MSFLITALSSISSLLSAQKEEAWTCKELLFHLGLFGRLCSLRCCSAEDTTELCQSAQMTRMEGITGSQLMGRGCAFMFDVQHQHIAVTHWPQMPPFLSVRLSQTNRYWEKQDINVEKYSIIYFALGNCYVTPALQREKKPKHHLKNNLYYITYVDNT